MRQLLRAALLTVLLASPSACSSSGADCAFCAQARSLCPDASVAACRCGKIPPEANECAAAATSCSGVIGCPGAGP